ncbi:MAG: glutaminyl-peptide cyclotransferase [Blastocatellia bacterium]
MRKTTRILKSIVAFQFLIVFIIASRPQCAAAGSERGQQVEGFAVQAKYPHDPRAFTQGLEYHDGYLYESTGLNGQSSLRKVDLKTGELVKEVNVPAQYFAEGLTILGNKIYQLTWQTKLGFIYDLDTFKQIGQFSYDWEGWGLTNDGQHLIMSDGSNKLRFVDPNTFRVVKAIDVFSQRAPLRELNELEYINGVIFSNIWHSNQIARIDAKTGKLLGFVDLTGLSSGLNLGEEDVLNGIAYDKSSDHLIVTGKRWPAVFVIAIRSRRQDSK